ncbi:MAG TPA: hypothetical protein VHN11_03045, partial [Xanthobacteraceae bacterium]|nr:hypothetical protein [Xanthobacteraceae bacterium]
VGRSADAVRAVAAREPSYWTWPGYPTQTSPALNLRAQEGLLRDISFVKQMRDASAMPHFHLKCAEPPP